MIWSPGDNLTVRWADTDSSGSDDAMVDLTPRERTILDLVAEGMTNRQIAEKVFLAEKTVKNYVSTILSKLEVGRRAEAAAYLARHTGTPGSTDRG